MANKIKQRLVKSQVPGFIGTLLVLLGIFGLMNAGNNPHSLLDDERITYALIVVGVLIWLKSFAGISSFIRHSIKVVRSAKASDSTDEYMAETDQAVNKKPSSSNFLIYLLIAIFIAAFLYENLDHLKVPTGSESLPEASVTKTVPKAPEQHSSRGQIIAQFYKAVASGNAEIVRELYASLKPDYINTVVSGMTPVMKASSMGNTEIVSFLLEKGADPNKRGSQQRTALQYAAERNRLAVAKLLLQHGADINGVDATKLSPLTMAADRRYRDFAIFLIEKGADVNIQHVQGWTALIDAARNGDLVLVKRLVEAGADLRLHSANGLNALDFARNNKHIAVEEYLLKQYEK